MSIEKIIQSTIQKNPVEVAGFFKEEIENRIRLALEAKKEKMEWEYGEVEKRGGVWGWFRKHKSTGRSEFVAYGSVKSKKDAIERRDQEINKTKTESDDPCWKGYRQLGTKKKDGKEVPNCVSE